MEDEVVIGEKCVLMEGSLVESNSILSPGTVLPPGRLVPSGQLWAGNPAKFVRDLTKDEVVFNKATLPHSCIMQPVSLLTKMLVLAIHLARLAGLGTKQFRHCLLINRIQVKV